MDKAAAVQRAKTYLKMLCEGVHPVTGQEIPEDSVFFDEKVKKCFSFITETLDEYLLLAERVKELERERDQKEVVLLKKNVFSITEEQCNEIKLSPKPITLSTLMRNVNSVIDKNTMKRLTSARINKWLTEKGFLQHDRVETLVKRSVYTLLDPADKIGITEKEILDEESGEVKKQIVFDEKAQLFIIENLPEIVKTV